MANPMRICTIICPNHSSVEYNNIGNGIPQGFENRSLAARFAAEKIALGMYCGGRGYYHSVVIAPRLYRIELVRKVNKVLQPKDGESPLNSPPLIISHKN